MSTNAGVVIDAPSLTPPPQGLLNSAQVPESAEGDERWYNGIQLQPEVPTDATTFDPCSSSSDSTPGNGGGKVELLPFGIQAYAKCSTWGYQKADYEGRARRALAAHESKAVEREFLTAATIATNRHLQDDNTDHTAKLAGSTALGLRTALATLVQAAADNNLGAAMIHVRPFIAEQWAAMNMVRWNNGKLYTLTGHLIVPGSGYTGAAPDGTAATGSAEWAYVTESVLVKRGPVVVDPDPVSSTDRTNNTVTVRAQRIYSVVGNFNYIGAAKINPTSTS